MQLLHASVPLLEAAGRAAALQRWDGPDGWWGCSWQGSGSAPVHVLLSGRVDLWLKQPLSLVCSFFWVALWWVPAGAHWLKEMSGTGILCCAAIPLQREVCRYLVLLREKMLPFWCCVR